MNITTQVAEEIGGRIQQTINMNTEIQIYHYNDGYSWRDSRVKETSWENNQRGLTFEQLKEELELNILKVGEKVEEKLELRMYGFVPYQLKGMQGGIQFGHAVVDYGRMVRDIPVLEDQYNDWADNWKTVIVYNGGTTNDREDYYGTMQTYRDQLKENGIPYCEFREPDLGDVLIGVCFIGDERMFNREKYPDFKETIISEIGIRKYNENKKDFLASNNTINPIPSNVYPEKYKKWVETIGGEKNVFLREFKKNFSLAN